MLARSRKNSGDPATVRVRRTARGVTLAGCTFWVIVVAAITVPATLGEAGSGLDASWRVALSLSHRLGLPMGSRLLFSYGPYGYLTVTVPFFFRQWAEAVAAGLVIHVTLLSLVGLLLVRRLAGPVVWGVVTVALIIGLPSFVGPEIQGQLVAILAAFFAVDSRLPGWQIASAVLCGAALALLLLMKATAVPLTAGVLILGIGALLLRRRHRTALFLAAAFIATGAVLWSAAGLSVGDVARYLRAAVEFGWGYSGAMYLTGLTAGSVLGGAIVLMFAAIGASLVARRRHAEGLLLLLAGVALFSAFKDSFVRDEPFRNHVYFGLAGLLAALSVVVVAPSARNWWSRGQLVPAALLTACACLTLGLAWRASDISDDIRVTSRLAGYATVVRGVLHASIRRELERQMLAAAEASYANIISVLPNFPADSTVDVMPWDIGIIYADSALHWDPRPVLQSYSAYTPWLDQQDADFLRGNAAPDFIIYSYLTIDGRYPAFDEPATFRALLENYRVVKAIGSSAVVLQRLAATRASDKVERTTCAALGTAIDVPQRVGMRTFANIQMTRTLAGSTLNLLAKAPEARVTLNTAAMSFDGRLVQAVAGDGLYVSNFLSSSPDIGPAISGSGGVPITSLAVRGDPAGWSSRYCVTFTTASLNTRQAP